MKQVIIKILNKRYFDIFGENIDFKPVGFRLNNEANMCIVEVNQNITTKRKVFKLFELKANGWKFSNNIAATDLFSIRLGDCELSLEYVSNRYFA